jgi:sulfatase modifying factor 1
MTVLQIQTYRCLPQFISPWIIFTVLGIIFTPSGLASQKSGDSRRTGNHGIRWIKVDAGTFTMGSGSSVKQVTLDRFMMSATEITFDQYDAFCDASGKEKPDDNGWGRGTRPVINVSYDDAVEFSQWLSEETKSVIRLPNEAEWEYAAQGGCQSRGYGHSGGHNKDEVSWNEGNSGNRTHPVGTKKPNELGLFDMSGNLWEWCSDWSGTNMNGSQTEHRDTEHKDKMPLRGNSFDNPGDSMGFRISLQLERDSRHYNIGFRIVKSE